MGQIYKHIDAVERDFIHRHLNEGRSHRWIAAQLGRPASAVSREVGRNRDEARGYDGIDAGQFALDRRRRGPGKLRDGSGLREYLFAHLRKGWSPRQISGALACMPQAIGHVSHETIYQTIYVTRQTSQDQGLLLRSAQSVAAPDQREHQWPCAAVPAKRRRSEPVFTPRSGKDRSQPQHKAPGLSRLSNSRGSVLQ